MSGGELGNETLALYDRMRMEEVFHVPPSAVHVVYHPEANSRGRGVLHRTQGSGLTLDVYASSVVEGTEVVAAFFADRRLMVASSFGARHGALLYMLPVFHLMTFLLAIAIGVTAEGIVTGIFIGLVAAASIPLLIFWEAASLETRRLTLKNNLEMTGIFRRPIEIDEMIAWLHTKVHNRRYWAKQVLFYEICYVPLTLSLIFVFLSD